MKATERSTMSADLHSRLHDLEAEVASLRAALDESTPTPGTSRRNLLRAAAVGAVGVVGGAAAFARPAAAATGQPLVLGQANTADAVTSLENNGPFPDLAGPGPVALELKSPGGHVHFVGSPGDAILGTYPDGTLAYNGSQGLRLQTNNEFVRVGQAGFGPLLVLSPPIRLYDSRTLHIGGTTRNGPISGGQDRPISIGIDNNDQVIELPAADVRAAMINLTITETVGAGYLAVGNPGPDGVPTTSNINWSASSQTLANLAVVTLFEGNLTVFAGGGGSTQFIVDLMGLVG
jgi:hypothetical protein